MNTEIIKSLLEEAIEVAELVDDLRTRTSLKGRIGHAMQQFGLETQFGNYAEVAITAWHAQTEEQFSREWQIQRQGRSEKLRELEREAKRLFLAGDLSGAEEIYLSAEELRDDHMRWGLLGARSSFLSWQLESGNIVGALEFFKSVEWGAPTTRVLQARKIAEAFIAAGDRSRGLGVLRELRPKPDAQDSYETLCWLGQSLWLIGEMREGTAVLREAAQASLAAAQKNERLPLWGYSSCEPIAIAQIQAATGDLQGAVETLMAVLQLGSSIDFEPEPLPPIDSLPRLFFWTSALKPAARRWIASLPDLTRVLARAGLDDEAFQFLKVPEMNQLDLLCGIVLGQAQRGAFETAFRTLERILTNPLTAKSEPSRISLKPTGEISAFTQHTARRPVEELERRTAYRRGMFSILRSAARLGDIDAYKRADALWKPIAEPHQTPLRDFDELRMLAKANQANFAMGFARAVPDSGQRVCALLKVAEGLAGISGLGDSSFYAS